MKRLIFLILIALSSNIFAQWIKINTPTNALMAGLFFINENTGILCGTGGLILKTTDGGYNWEVKLSGVTDHLDFVYMTSDSIGYIAGYNGVLLKTNDGGDTWFTIDPGSWINIKSLYFFNDTVGFYSGQGQIIAKTIDGGSTWDIQDYGDYWMRDIYFPSQDIGYCVGDGGNFYKTINGGDSWFPVSQGVPNQEWWSVHFPTINTGYACGKNGKLLKTINGGENWTNIDLGISESLICVFFFNENHGYVTGASTTLLHTYDGGQTWISEESNTNAGIGRIFFVNEEIGYIAGQGFILKKCIPPSAGFIFLIDNLTVSFTHTSSSGDTFWWDFGDGYLSALQNPVYTFSEPGTYDVCLIVTDSCSSDTVCKQIVIPQTGINELNNSGKFIIYPNPNNGSFVISNPYETYISQIRLIDIFGKKLDLREINGNKSEIIINTNLNVGLYYLVIISNEKQILKKLIIE